MPLKHPSNFWRTSEMSLINYEVCLTLTWSESCVITRKAARDADPDADPAVDDNPTNATFKIKDTKLHVPVVILSVENNNKLLQQLKTRFK